MHNMWGHFLKVGFLDSLFRSDSVNNTISQAEINICQFRKLPSTGWTRARVGTDGAEERYRVVTGRAVEKK
jgi:hypothetical protein